jgi:ABC-type transport system involved in cytochrome c biogenesis permease subunit
MKNSATALFEVVWFVLGGLMLFIAVDITLSNGFRESWHYYLIALLAFLIYYFRRRMRISRH